MTTQPFDPVDLERDEAPPWLDDEPPEPDEGATCAYCGTAAKGGTCDACFEQAIAKLRATMPPPGPCSACGTVTDLVHGKCYVCRTAEREAERAAERDAELAAFSARIAARAEEARRALEQSPFRCECGERVTYEGASCEPCGERHHQERERPTAPGD